MPKEPVTLPSAKRSLPVSLLKGISQSSDNLANTDGCTTLIVDPVSINPITYTPLTNKGRYKLPVASVSSSTMSRFGPNISLAADTWASVAARARFPSHLVVFLSKPDQSHLCYHFRHWLSAVQQMSFVSDIHGSSGLQHHSDDMCLAFVSRSWEASLHWHHHLYQSVWPSHSTVFRPLQTSHEPMKGLPSQSFLALEIEPMGHLWNVSKLKAAFPASYNFCGSFW